MTPVAPIADASVVCCAGALSSAASSGNCGRPVPCPKDWASDCCCPCWSSEPPVSGCMAAAAGCTGCAPSTWICVPKRLAKSLTCTVRSGVCAAVPAVCAATACPTCTVCTTACGLGAGCTASDSNGCDPRTTRSVAGSCDRRFAAMSLCLCPPGCTPAGSSASCALAARDAAFLAGCCASCPATDTPALCCAFSAAGKDCPASIASNFFCAVPTAVSCGKSVCRASVAGSSPAVSNCAAVSSGAAACSGAIASAARNAASTLPSALSAMALSSASAALPDGLSGSLALPLPPVASATAVSCAAACSCGEVLPAVSAFAGAVSCDWVFSSALPKLSPPLSLAASFPCTRGSFSVLPAAAALVVPACGATLIIWVVFTFSPPTWILSSFPWET